MINSSSFVNIAVNAFAAPQISDSRNLLGASLPVKTSAPKAAKAEVSQSVPVEPSAISVKAKEVSSSLNMHFGHMGLKLKAVIDSESKKFVIKVVDPETNEVIKQFPEDSLFEIGKKVDSLLQSYSGSQGESLALLEDLTVTT